MTHEHSNMSGSFDPDAYTPIEMAEITCVSTVTAISLAAQVAQASDVEAEAMLLTVAATLPLEVAEA
jgi:hypothetical protein